MIQIIETFTLIGDPALRLAYPKYDVVLTNIQDSAQARGYCYNFWRN